MLQKAPEIVLGLCN